MQSIFIMSGSFGSKSGIITSLKAALKAVHFSCLDGRVLCLKIIKDFAAVSIIWMMTIIVISIAYLLHCPTSLPVTIFVQAVRHEYHYIKCPTVNFPSSDKFFVLNNFPREFIFQFSFGFWRFIVVYNNRLSMLSIGHICTEWTLNFWVTKAKE